MKFDKRMRSAQEKLDEGKAALENVKYQRAVDNCLEAANRFKNIRGQELNYADCLGYAACALNELGSSERAKKTIEKALSIQEKLLDSSHPDFVRNLNTLANIYSRQKDYTQAESLYTQVLKIRENESPVNHIDVAKSLNNLANVYSAQKDYEKATSLYEQALDRVNKASPVEQTIMATIFNNIAHVNSAQGNYEKAKSLCEKALEIWKKTLSANHPDIARSYAILAFILKKLGELDSAKEYEQKASKIMSETLGVNHPDTYKIARSLADTVIKTTPSNGNSFSPSVQLHEAVFQFLVEIDETNNNVATRGFFTFRTSKNDEQGRLSKGYWFSGDDESLYFSCWKGIDTTVQMPTIALVIDTEQKLSIHLNGKDSPKKAEFLADIANLLGGFAQVPDKNGTLEAQWKKTYSQTWEQALEEFLSTDKPQIDEYLTFKGNEIDDFTQISEKEFAQSLKFTLFLRDKLKNSVEQELSEVGKPLKLQFLQLENIGHFKEVGFDLSKQVTILIGENGSGKSTVLKAIALGLSNVAQTMDTALVQDYLRIIKTDADKEHNSLKKQYCLTGEIRLGFQLNKLQTQTLEFKTTDLGGVEINPFIENNDDWLLVSQNRFIDLILGFPQGKKRPQKSLAKIEAPNLNDVLALIEERDTPEWKLDIKKWIYHLHAQRDENPQNLEKINTVFELFSKIIEDEDNEAFIRLKDVVYNSDTGEEDVIICTPDMPEGISLDLISQGYNNIFVWIGRLIMRLYDALKVHQQEHHAVSKDNKFLKNLNTRGKRYEANSIYELHGIVLIDEIDTYLHPKWQRNILQVLAETFPCLQFVVTSHSLAVLSSLKDKDSYMIYRAFKDDEGQICFEELDPHKENPYGADLNSVAQNTMDISIREPEIQNKLKELRSLIAKKKIEDADKLVAKLKDLISLDDPEFVRLRDRLDSEKFTLGE